MCGIIAIYTYNSAAGVDRNELLCIRDHMSARGPDGYGEWYSSDNRVGLGHRRLAIIDLSEAGAQPMQTADGNIVVIFNGEIYNYQTIRADLEKRGYHFRSTSDTEVLLHLYEEKGADMFNDLRGMFSFAIWDNKKKGLFLARDPLGIKPLYYTNDGRTFRAASQVKALLEGGNVDTSPEPAGHVGFFLWGYVPEPYTLYHGIRSLPAGCQLWIEQDGKQSLRRYSSIPDILAEAKEKSIEIDRAEMQEILRDILLDSIRHHLIADVPVGVFLSSGLDSTTMAAIAAETITGELHTITLGFKEYRGTKDDEVPLAELVASHYGSKHQTILVEKKDFQKDFQRILDVMDQPSIDGVNSYFVSKAAVQAGLKVAISGLGGDELFGGYPSFRQIPMMVNTFKNTSFTPFIGKAFRSISSPVLKHFTSPKYAGLLEYGGSYSGAYLLKRGMFMPWELPELLDGEMVKKGWEALQVLVRLDENIRNINSSYLKVSSLEMCWYMRNQLLRDTDWASMAHSLEVRVPMVDYNFLRSIAPMFYTSTAPSKNDLASTPKKPLPPEIMNRAKTGFSVPVREWLMNSDDSFVKRGLRGWAKKVYSAFCRE